MVDIKTARAKPTSIEPMQRFQAATYCRLTPGASGKGRIDTLVKSKTPQVTSQSFELTEADLAATQSLYPLIQNAMRANIHVPNRLALGCSRQSCAFWRNCGANGATGDFSGEMKPQRSRSYLASIRTQPCLVCGSTRWIEAAHTGPHGLGQKSRIARLYLFALGTTGPETTAIIG